MKMLTKKEERSGRTVKKNNEKMKSLFICKSRKQRLGQVAVTEISTPRGRRVVINLRKFTLSTLANPDEFRRKSGLLYFAALMILSIFRVGDVHSMILTRNMHHQLSPSLFFVALYIARHPSS